MTDELDRQNILEKLNDASKLLYSAFEDSELHLLGYASGGIEVAIEAVHHAIDLVSVAKLKGTENA